MPSRARTNTRMREAGKGWLAGAYHCRRSTAPRVSRPPFKRGTGDGLALEGFPAASARPRRLRRLVGIAHGIGLALPLGIARFPLVGGRPGRHWGPAPGKRRRGLPPEGRPPPSQETESLRMRIKTQQFRKMFHILVMNWKVPCFQRLGGDRGMRLWSAAATVEEVLMKFAKLGASLLAAWSGRHHHRRGTYFRRLRQPDGNSGHPGLCRACRN